MNGSEPNSGVVSSAPSAGSGQRLNLKNWLIRGGVLILITGSVAVAWWSLTQVLVPRQKLSQDLSTHVARLSAQVDDLERQRTSEDAARINSQFEQVPRQLLAGDAALDTWMAKLKEQLSVGGLAVQADFGAAQPLLTNGARIAVIPATLTLDAVPGASGSSSTYHRILQLSHQLSTQDLRADLKELTVTGGTNSIGRAVVALDLWAGEPGPK